LKPITPTSFQISVEGVNQSVPSFGSWLDEGASFSIASVVWENAEVKPSSPATYQVSTPVTIPILCRIYEATLKVVDYFGIPVSGAHAAITLANSTSVTASSGADGIISLGLIPLGQYQASVKNLGLTTQVAGNASVHSQTVATAPLSYPLIGVVIAVIAAVSATLFLLIRKRRQVNEVQKTPPSST
jgi:hypothetical protein